MFHVSCFVLVNILYPILIITLLSSPHVNTFIVKPTNIHTTYFLVHLISFYFILFHFILIYCYK